MIDFKMVCSCNSAKKRECLSTSSQGLASSSLSASSAEATRPQTVANYENYSIPMQSANPLHGLHYREHATYVNDLCAHSEFDSDFDDDLTELDCTDAGGGMLANGYLKMDKHCMQHEGADAAGPTFMTFLQAHKQAVNQVAM
jgi:hypothetical protein